MFRWWVKDTNTHNQWATSYTFISQLRCYFKKEKKKEVWLFLSHLWMSFLSLSTREKTLAEVERNLSVILSSTLLPTAHPRLLAVCRWSLSQPSIPQLHSCPCLFSSLISPQGRHDACCGCGQFTCDSLNSECKPKLVFICYSRVRSFFDYTATKWPSFQTSSPQFHIPTYTFLPNQHTLSHSGWVTLSNMLSCSVSTHHSCSRSLPHFRPFGRLWPWPHYDGPSLLHSS